MTNKASVEPSQEAEIRDKVSVTMHPPSSSTIRTTLNPPVPNPDANTATATATPTPRTRNKILYRTSNGDDSPTSCTQQETSVTVHSLREENEYLSQQLVLLQQEMESLKNYYENQNRIEASQSFHSYSDHSDPTKITSKSQSNQRFISKLNILLHEKWSRYQNSHCKNTSLHKWNASSSRSSHLHPNRTRTKVCNHGNILPFSKSRTKVKMKVSDGSDEYDSDDPRGSQDFDAIEGQDEEFHLRIPLHQGGQKKRHVRNVSSSTSSTAAPLAGAEISTPPSPSKRNSLLEQYPSQHHFESSLEEGTMTLLGKEFPPPHTSSISLHHSQQDHQEDNLELSFKTQLIDRAGWLVGLLMLQSMSSFILEKNEKLLQDHIIIVNFLTMLVGAGGNAGNQASVRVIRGIAIGTVNSRTMHQFLRHEAMMGLCLSFILCASGIIRTALFLTPIAESIAITSSLFTIVAISILLGAILPLAMKKCHIDPAHSSTTIQVLMDVLGVTITCWISSIMLDQTKQNKPVM